MLVKSTQKYYNTAKRQWAKKWSLLNVFFKTKKRVSYIVPKKKLYLIYPIILNYKNYILFYNFIKKECNFLYYKYKKNIKFIFFKKYKKINKIIKKKKYKNLFDIVIFFNYFISGFVLFFSIICFLLKSYIYEQKNSLKILLNKKFFSINVFYSLLKNYYINFINYNENWRYLLTSLSFDMQKYLTFFNIYNLKAFLSLDIFMLWLNIEELKYDNDRYFKKPEDWGKIRKLSFKYFNLNILKKNCISFFSFCIFELYIYIYKHFLNFLDFKFFNYWIDIDRENSYQYQKDREYNWRYKDLKYKKTEETAVVDFLNLDYTFLNLSNFNIRIQYRIFITWFNYIVFYKKMRYNLYIRNNAFFYNNNSKKFLFLHYNNPTSYNKTKVVMSKYEKIIREQHLGCVISLNDFNNEYSFYKIGNYKNLFKFSEKNNYEHLFFLQNFCKNFNIKFMINYLMNKHFRKIIKNFWRKNLFHFFKADNILNCYKLVMKVKSIYKYRKVNFPFSTLHQMVKVIFALPAEIIKYINLKNKQMTKSVLSNLFKKKFIPFYFFKDFYNYKNSLYLYKNLNLFKYMHKLSNLALYFFNPKFFFRLLKTHKLPFDVISDYKIKYKKRVCKRYWMRRLNFSKVLYNLHNLKKKAKKNNIMNFWDYRYIVKNFYGEWKGVCAASNIVSYKAKNKMKYITLLKKLDLRMFYLLLKYNTGFYFTRVNNIDNYSILYGLNIANFLKNSRFLNLLNKSNEFFLIGSYYKIIKFIPLLRNFYFQLLYEDKEYTLLLFFLFIKENKNFINNSKNFINIKNFFFNNFIYRHYAVIILYDSRFFDNMFAGLDSFIKEEYDKVLTPFIYRNNYLNYEHLFFYSLNIKNKFNFKNYNIII